MSQGMFIDQTLSIYLVIQFIQRYGQIKDRKSKQTNCIFLAWLGCLLRSSVSCAVRPGEGEEAGPNQLLKEFCLTMFKAQLLASPKFAYNCQNNLISSLSFLFFGGGMKKM